MSHQVRTEHIQFALLVELMQLVPGLEQCVFGNHTTRSLVVTLTFTLALHLFSKTDETEHHEWKMLSDDVESYLQSALRILTVQRKLVRRSARGFSALFHDRGCLTSMT